MKKKGLLRVVVPISLILALAVALPLMSGCVPAPPPEVAPPEVEPEVAPPEVEPIKVGALIPVTGPYAADGLTMDEGIRLAVEEINEQGGLLGRPVEMVVFDIEDMMAEKLIASAEKLIGRDKVDLVITGYAGMGPDYEVYGKYDVPYLNDDGSIRCIEMMEEDPNKWNILQMGEGEAAYGYTIFDATVGIPYEFPNNKVAIIAGDFEWDRLYMGGFKERAEETGWEVVMFEVVPYGTREWGPILTKIRTLDPALLAVEILDPADTVTLFREFMEDPTNTILQLGWSVIIPEFVEILGAEGDGILGASTTTPIYTPEAEAFKQRFKDRFGKEQSGCSGYVYQGVMAWAEAVRKVGDPTDYRAVIKRMRDHPEDQKVIVGIFDWREVQYAVTGPDYPMHLVQVQNGERVDLMLHLEPIPGRKFEIPPWLK